MSPRIVPFLVLAALLAGCVSQGPFPSLAPRPGEQLAIEEPVREAAEVPPDPALRQRVLELRQQAARGGRAFDAALGRAETAVRAAGAPGSDSWIEAQQAISRLEAARLDTTDALAQLDLLRSSRADLPTNRDDVEAIDAAFALVEGTLAVEQDRIDRLTAAIRR